MSVMYEVKLPTLDWFMCGNVYTGSFRPDLTKGCMCQTTFNYKVKIVEHKNGFQLVASCFYVLPWNCFSTMDEITLGRFEASSFGIEVAENWIRSKFISDYKLGIPQNINKSLQPCQKYIKA